MNTNLTSFIDAATQHVEAASPRARLVFALDATGSRQPTWERAKILQADMLRTASELGTLDISVGFFREVDDCQFTDFISDPDELAGIMAEVRTRAGSTQIQTVMDETLTRHYEKPIAALVFVGDTIEETRANLFARAQAMGTASPKLPMFIFHETTSDTSPSDETNFRKMAEMSGGAYAKFSEGSIAILKDLLESVAAYATGGLAALEARGSSAATLLLSQLK